MFAGVSVKLSGVGYVILAVVPYGTAVEGYVQPCPLVASYYPRKRRYVVAWETRGWGGGGGDLCLLSQASDIFENEINLSFSKR